jgi:pimeloyl-ACP methyl ester carboxylesterase
MNASLTSAGVTVDATRIDYVGQSLGGILGTLYTAVSPDVHSVVLNVPGGYLTQVLAEATDPNFVAMKTILYSTLASKGMPQGSPAFDTFVRSGQWILDPGDPINYSWYVMNGTQVPADREALVQYITRDTIIPNSTTQALLDSANLRGGSSKLLSFIKYDPSDTELPPNSRHGFLFSSTPTAAQAQSDVVQFLQP